MRDNEIQFFENLSGSEESVKLNFGSFKNGVEEIFTSITYKGDNINKFSNFSECKDRLFYRAIGNLVKKTEFLQLYIQLAEGQISEDEYEKELEGNSEKYFIHLKPIDSEQHFKALIDILQKCPNSFSIDEISEIFGISTDSILEINK